MKKSYGTFTSFAQRNVNSSGFKVLLYNLTFGFATQ